MRVLLITGSYPPMRCGVGDYCCRLANSLAADPDVKVGVLTSDFNGMPDKIHGIEIFKLINKWSLSEVLKVIRTINSWSPHVVHIQYPTQGYGSGFLPWVVPLISYLMGKKIVQTWHEGASIFHVWKLFLKSVVPSGVVVVRPLYKDNLHPLLRWCLWGKRLVFIPNASAIPRVDLNEQDKSTLKTKYLNQQKRLIVFFGFVYPHKGTELLFEIADPATDHIVIAGEIGAAGIYEQEITQCASAQTWLGKVTITGFLPAEEIAALLAVADAVILPFRRGGGEWNTSIHGAVLNDAFVITTSLSKNGYDENQNVYFAAVDNVHEMKTALTLYAGKRRESKNKIRGDEWRRIANEHRMLYENILGEMKGKGAN